LVPLGSFVVTENLALPFSFAMASGGPEQTGPPLPGGGSAQGSEAQPPSLQARRERWRSKTSLRILLFALETALGMLLVGLVANLVHSAGWLLSVATLLYLLIVVPTALLCGFWQAVVVSLTAVIVQSYLTVRHPGNNPLVDPANPVTFIAFILTALVVSHLSSQASRHAEEAELRREQIEDLYEFTRMTLQMNLHEEPGNRLASLVKATFDIDAVAIYDADLHMVYEAGEWLTDPRETVQNVFYFGTVDDNAETGIGRRVLRMGNLPIGALLLKGTTTSLTNDAIASLIAVTFDRYRAFINESQVEAERQTEQLRTTVLDSLAHAYKTPLTAIRAASTGLEEMGSLTAAQRELVALIDEQSGLLNDLTTRLLKTARLDADDVLLHTSPVEVIPMVDEVVAMVRQRHPEMQVVFDYSSDHLVLSCDEQLVSSIVTQYVENACKYANMASPITVRVEQTLTEMIFSVHSFGPVIPLAERERIFDRFFRSSASSHLAPGTGIGLSVAKRAARLHDGHVWVTSDDQEGTTFYAAIPTQDTGGFSE
jgi:two-component system sensor histidine kinase KdpD